MIAKPTSRWHATMLTALPILGAMALLSFCRCGSGQGDGGLATADAASGDARADVRSDSTSSDSKDGPTGSDVDDRDQATPPDAIAEEGGGCSVISTPVGVPAGWELHCDWSPQCGIYVPGSKGQMPSLAVWKTCPAEAPKGVVCRMIDSSNSIYVGKRAFWVDPTSGKGQLAYSRPSYDAPNQYFRLVEEVDGIVRFAVLLDKPGVGCVVSDPDTHQGKVALNVQGIRSSASSDLTRQAIMGGDNDDRHLQVVYRYDFTGIQDPLGMSSTVSADYVMRHTARGDVAVNDWSFANEYLVHADTKDPDGLPAFDFLLLGKDAFFTASGTGRSYIMSWNKTDGTRPLLRWEDNRQAAGNFGTDAKDMVWTYGEDHDEGALYRFKTALTMTAPYTTDPAVLKQTARALRSEMDRTLNPELTYQVGCGYAARRAWGNRLTVVRLSDGSAWTIDGPAAPNQYDWAWGRTIGVTCDEVFTSVQNHQVMTIARIRIDSLGDPTPSDLAGDAGM